MPYPPTIHLWEEKDYKPDQTLGLNVFSTCASTSSGRLQKKSMPVRFSSSLIEMACERNVSFMRHAFVCSLQNAMPAYPNELLRRIAM